MLYGPKGTSCPTPRWGSLDHHHRANGIRALIRGLGPRAERAQSLGHLKKSL